MHRWRRPTCCPFSNWKLSLSLCAFQWTPAVQSSLYNRHFCARDKKAFATLAHRMWPWSHMMTVNSEFREQETPYRLFFFLLCPNISQRCAAAHKTSSFKDDVSCFIVQWMSKAPSLMFQTSLVRSAEHTTAALRGSYHTLSGSHLLFTWFISFSCWLKLWLSVFFAAHPQTVEQRLLSFRSTYFYAPIVLSLNSTQSGVKREMFWSCVCLTWAELVNVSSRFHPQKGVEEETSLASHQPQRTEHTGHGIPRGNCSNASLPVFSFWAKTFPKTPSLFLDWGTGPVLPCPQ